MNAEINRAEITQHLTKYIAINNTQNKHSTPVHNSSNYV